MWVPAFNHYAFESESVSPTPLTGRLPAGEHRWIAEAGLLAARENGACMRCNIGWITVFDELGRYGLDLGQKLRAAFFLAKKWSSL